MLIPSLRLISVYVWVLLPARSFVLIICFSAVDLYAAGAATQEQDPGYDSIPSPEGGGAAVMCLRL